MGKTGNEKREIRKEIGREGGREGEGEVDIANPARDIKKSKKGKKGKWVVVLGEGGGGGSPFYF